MDLSERISDLEQAQELMRDAAELIKRAVKGTSQEHVNEAYVESHLRILTDNESGYLSRSTNVQSLIDGLNEENNDSEF